jgi:hypothetical protein
LEGIDRILWRPFSFRARREGGWFLGLKPQAESVVPRWPLGHGTSFPSAVCRGFSLAKSGSLQGLPAISSLSLLQVSVPVASLTKSPSATFEQFQDNNLAKNE